MRLLHIFSLLVLMVFSVEAKAGIKVLIGTPVAKSQVGKQQQVWLYPFEISELKIRQSNDGRGIIKHVTCPDCDYKFVKINANTKVIVNGVEVNLLRARERSGKNAYIEFDRKTAEVKRLYWAE